MDCHHKCHRGRGLNPWVERCPSCGCANARYDAANAAALREKFIVEMEEMGWQGFRETVDLLNY